MSIQMFSDESKARGYITAAVVVPTGSVARFRSTCREWAMPGSRRFHAQKESTGRRRMAMASLVSMCDVVQVVMVESGAPKFEAEAREQHLIALARWAAEEDVTRWVIERDRTVEHNDRRALAAARAGSAAIGLEYVHLPAVQDPILWAADLAAWSWSRGGEFRAAIRPLVVVRIRL